MHKSAYSKKNCHGITADDNIYIQFRKVSFIGILVMANLCMLNQFNGNNACTTDLPKLDVLWSVI